MNIKHITRGAVATVAALLLAHSAEAASYDVTLNTTSLSLPAATNAPYYLDFQFSGQDNLNTATLGGFSFTGLTAGLNGSITTNGVVSGDTGTSISISASGGISEWYQAINSGTLGIHFTLDLTTLAPASLSPDQFTISILDTNLATIPTTDSFGSIASFVINNDGTTNATYTGLTPTTVSASVTAVPEPSTYILFGLGAVVLIVAFRRRTA